MRYSPRLFDSDDAPSSAGRPSSGPGASFPTALAEACALQLKRLEAFSLEGDEEILDQLFRTNHVLAGMCGLYGLAPAARLLGVLDFALDLGRSLKTLGRHSVDYLAKLYLARVAAQAQAWAEGRPGADADLADLLDEARTYLAAPLAEWNRRADEAPALAEEAPEPVPAASGAPLAPAAPPPAPDDDAIPFDDGPEPLDVPLDKLGMISDFYEENAEILANFGNGLVDLEADADPRARVNDLFRMIHTVKGGARLLHIQKMECLAHAAESLLDRVRQGSLAPGAEVIDALLDAKGILAEMLEETASRGPFSVRIRPAVGRLRALARGENPIPAAPVAAVPASPGPSSPSAPSASPGAPAAPPTSPAPAAPVSDKAKGAESLRVSSEKLDEVLNTASEIFIGRIRFQNEITAIQNFLKSFKATLDRAGDLERSRLLAKLELYIPEFAKEFRRALDQAEGRPKALEARLPALLGQVVGRVLPDASGTEMSLQEELNLNYLTIEEIQKQLQKNLETLEQLSTRLQNGAMSFRMVPIANLFERFPLQLRDLARTIGKKVRVDIVGGDTELDKVLINKLADPLLHMLRNSIDHGIEAPADRLSAGKAEAGTITLKTYYHGSYAVLEVKDDGRGIDVNRVYEKALGLGLVPEAKKGKLTEAEILDLIFLPGFSTNEKVTELSGRGVGMDVVRTALNQLHGTIETETKAGQGTLFRLRLPLTLAIVKILLVQESSYQFALPILNIEALIQAQRSALQRVDDRLVFNYQGQTIPVASLSTILGFPRSPFAADPLPMVILNEANRLTGILVDSVLGRQEILIKNLGRFLQKAPFVMGCTILRDSRLVLILDPRQIVEAVKQAGAADLAEAPDPGRPDDRPAVLIVDDSAIQRENLRSILKDSPFRVDLAENGFDALKACRTKTYAAFCVDILMPLMDGYEFVERLRKLDQYRQTPVYFITGKDPDPQRMANLRATEVFRKPVDGAALVQSLTAAVQEAL